jgi:hypothetical protein
MMLVGGQWRCQDYTRDQPVFWGWGEGSVSSDSETPPNVGSGPINGE